MMYGLGCGDGYGAVGFFLMALMVVLFAVAILWGIRSLGHGSHIGYNQETALDILKKRYAKGDITKDEYDRMKKDVQ